MTVFRFMLAVLEPGAPVSRKDWKVVQHRRTGVEPVGFNGGSMRILWTLFKVALGLALAIPLGIVVLVLGLAILGMFFGLAVLTLKLFAIAFIGYGLFKVARYLFAGTSKAKAQPTRDLPLPDPYYAAAMRELDAEMGHTSGR